MNLEVLVRRAAIVKTIRRFFDDAGFLEVETPVRLAAPAPETHIDCPPVTTGGFLRASPELQMKKLLAAGLEKIYQIGPCFRDGEKGSRHNPEFTMIEWYRRDATYLDIKADLESLMATLLGASATMRAITVRDAYREWAGWDPWTDWDQDRFDFDMATVIEPKLKEMGGGVFLMDYPPQAASLAVVRGETSFLEREDAGRETRDMSRPSAQIKECNIPHLNSQLSTLNSQRFSAERWEFYWDGMELANCFTELCDAEEQRRRFVAARAERRELGESDYPFDEEFFAALPQIGSAAGVALGVDRLVMVLTGIRDIASVRTT